MTKLTDHDLLIAGAGAIAGGLFVVMVVQCLCTTGLGVCDEDVSRVVHLDGLDNVI